MNEQKILATDNAVERGNAVVAGNTAAAAKPTEYTLKHPYTTPAGVRLAKLVFQRITVKQMRRALSEHQKEFDQDLALFAASAGMLVEDIEEMDLEDFTAAMPIFRKSIRS